MSDLNISESLTFSQPIKQQDGVLNWVSFKSSSGLGAEYGPGDNASFKISSSTQYWIPQRSYIKYTLTPTATGQLNPSGGTSVFSSIQTSLGGLMLPLSRNFAIQNSIKNNSSTNEKKNILTKFQAFTDNGTGLATTAATPIPIVTEMLMPFKITSNQYVPLSFLTGGVQMYFNMSAETQVVTAGTYKISNFEIICCLLTPTPMYMNEVSEALAAGQTMKMQIELFKSFSNITTKASETSIQIQTGYLGSINSVFLSLRSDNSFSSQEGIASFNIDMDGVRYPLNVDVASGGSAFYQTLAGYNTDIGSISVPNDSQKFYSVPFKSNDMPGSGLPSQNGQINLNLKTNALTNTKLETIIHYDGEIVISQSAVLLRVDI